MSAHAVEDDVHRERQRIELRVHLAPVERGGDRRARAGSHGVGRRDRLALAVLVGVDEDAAPVRLLPLRRCEARVRESDSTRDEGREVPRVGVRVATLDGDEDVDAVGAAGLRVAAQPKLVERLDRKSVV